MKSNNARTKGSPVSAAKVTSRRKSFSEVVRLIHAAREWALAAVNTALVDLLANRQTFTRRIASVGWGKGTGTALATFI
jgi:hypothetical protein